MTNDVSPWRFCVAPMLDWTDSHCRVFHRALSKRARLYTEMVTAPALEFGDRARLLRFNAAEHPVACQVGGSDPEQLKKAARWIEEAGYDEINLNCGCPSERVQKGSFGACLMLEPKLVAECFRAMSEVTRLPVTIKHRVGVDGQDDYGFVEEFVGTLFEAGCRVFIVHTRSAWLKGLSPKENREVPPLRREYAAQLKKEFPEATIVVNGGIHDLGLAEELLKTVDGVMLGREVYTNPWILSDVDARLFGETSAPVTREVVIEEMTHYLESNATDPKLPRATARHMLGLLNGLAGAKSWRRFLSSPKSYAQFGSNVLREAYARAGWRESTRLDSMIEDEDFF